MKTIFVYGSLRQGHYNHRIIENAEFLGQFTMYDWEMYSLGSYPTIVKGEGYVVVEAYEVSDEQYERVRSMELGAGYKQATAIMSIRGKQVTGEFWHYENKPTQGRVQSGDWNQHNKPRGQ
jgi:gamma-glutamylcyclotransferase (GGCT)/AIG2-like uncharacterized protein YtfP